MPFLWLTIKTTLIPKTDPKPSKSNIAKLPQVQAREPCQEAITVPNYPKGWTNKWVKTRWDYKMVSMSSSCSNKTICFKSSSSSKCSKISTLCKPSNRWGNNLGFLSSQWETSNHRVLWDAIWWLGSWTKMSKILLGMCQAWAETLATILWWVLEEFKPPQVISITTRERSSERWYSVSSSNLRPSHSTTSPKCRKRTCKIIIEIWKSRIIFQKMRILDWRPSCNRYKKSWITGTKSWNTSHRDSNNHLHLQVMEEVAKLHSIIPTRALWFPS